jgi:hypothetical protein
MSSIPKARQILTDIIPDVAAISPEAAERLQAALSLMTRRTRARRASPDRSRPVDPTLAARIRGFAHANPDLSQQDIAVVFGTNHGRVSEALQHDR